MLLGAQNLSATADCWLSALAVLRPEALRIIAGSLEMRFRFRLGCSAN